MAMVVYGPNYSTYTRTVRMVLEEKEAAYALVEVDLLKGEHRQPGHLARNPFGPVPAFDHDGFVLYETRAIARYIDRVLRAPPLTPSEPKAEARMLQIQGIVDSFAYAAMIGAVFMQRAILPMTGGTADEAAIEAAMPRASLALAEIERLMGAGPWLGGGEPSLADLWVAPVLAYFLITPEGTRAIVPHARLRGWWDRIQERPSFQRTIPKLG